MSNLARIDDLANLGLNKFTDEDFDASTSSNTDYLPQIRLMTSNSGPCKEGEFPVNNYALIADSKFTDLGKNVDALIVAFRPRAIRVKGAFVASSDPSSETFQQIVEASKVKDSGNMYGPEFLLYLPSVSQWATLLMASPSARRVSPSLKANLQKAVTLGSATAKNDEYTWKVISCITCSTLFDLPTSEDLLAQAEVFNNPVDTGVELVAGETRDR